MRSRHTIRFQSLVKPSLHFSDRQPQTKLIKSCIPIVKQPGTDYKKHDKDCFKYFRVSARNRNKYMTKKVFLRIFN